MENAISKMDFVVQISEKAFLAESDRKKSLDDKADKFTSAIAVVLGFQLLDLKTVTFPGIAQATLYNWFSIATLTVLGVSLFFALISRRMQGYNSYPRGPKFPQLTQMLEDSSIKEEIAKSAMAHMYLEAHEINGHFNDRRARYLSYSGTLLLIGFLLAVSSYVSALSGARQVMKNQILVSLTPEEQKAIDELIEMSPNVSTPEEALLCTLHIWAASVALEKGLKSIKQISAIEEKFMKRLAALPTQLEKYRHNLPPQKKEKYSQPSEKSSFTVPSFRVPSQPAPTFPSAGNLKGFTGGGIGF
jgi:hypothetical protein